MPDYTPPPPEFSKSPGEASDFKKQPRGAGVPGLEALSKQLAWLLDNSIPIPGTSRRIGIDPLIGLIPGVGDTVATLMGSVILADALQRGLPGMLVFRMGGNMVLNAAVGAIPLVGDLFSAWFKSNARNYAILSAWVKGNPQPPAGAQDRWLVGAVILLILISGAFCLLAWWLLAKLWQVIFG